MTSGEFAGGRLLPSESELSEAYGVSRVTVRKALEWLRDDGLVDSRQGFGWFACADPLRQTLGHLGTIEAQLAESGRSAERRILEFAFVKASRRAKEVLDVDTVLRVRRLNLADGLPFARVTVWCPEALGVDLSRRDVEQRSFYELLPISLGGAVQTIGAAAAAEADAKLLEIPVGSPVLRCERVTSASDGTPVLLSEFVFPASRTEFLVDLPTVERSIAPSGLRLTDLGERVGQGRAARGFRRPSPSCQVRRHEAAAGPARLGVLPSAARRRAAQKPLSCSSARTAIACSMRVAKARASSPSSARIGRPNVTNVDDGVRPLAPRLRMRRVPSMWTGTTGTPARMARWAGPAWWACPQPSGLRPPSGKMTRLQPSASIRPASRNDFGLTRLRSIGIALMANDHVAAFHRVSKK